MWNTNVVFLSLFCATLAAVTYPPLDGVTETKGFQGCYNMELDMVIPFGQNVPSKLHCWEYRCGPDIHHLHPWFITCPTVTATPPCYLVEDKSKTYPGCCPVVKCD